MVLLLLLAGIYQSEKGEVMFKKVGYLILISVLLFSTVGCALIGTALSAGAAYGIYQATRK